MVAEGAFAAQLAELDVALEDDFGVGGDFEIDGFALDDLDGLAAQEAGDHELFDFRRRGDDGGKGGCRIGADGDGDFEPRAFQVAERDLRQAADGAVGDRRLRRRRTRPWRRRCAAARRRPAESAAAALRRAFAIVLGGNFLPLPVHAGGLAVVDLHAIHADVALAGARVARVHAGQRDEAAAIVGPALEDGECVEIEVFAENDFFAGRVFGADGFGKGAGERAELRQHFELVEEAFGSFDVHQASDALGDFVEIVDAESESHAALAAELVDEHLVAGMAFDVFKEQRRTAGGVLGTPFFCEGELPRAPILLTRSVISVISSSGETSSRMRFSSPCFSRA